MFFEMTRRELTERLVGAAEPVYGLREAEAIARLVAERRYGLSRADCALEPNREIDTFNFQLSTFNSLLADLAAARPVQYILGVADFDGMELAVGEGVLVPRPETEELVRWVITNYELRITSGAPRILDIGTGSGAIAIALAKRLPRARVMGIDISPEALEYARQNNEKHSAGVELIEADILDEKTLSTFNFQLSTKFDTIVSNPPYIPAAEKERMAANVAEHEPPGALFVPDDDPLLFYRAIARLARRCLAPGGELYFETHELTAERAVETVRAEGFAQVELRRDINDKPRMIRACF